MPRVGPSRVSFRGQELQQQSSRLLASYTGFRKRTISKSTTHVKPAAAPRSDEHAALAGAVHPSTPTAGHDDGHVHRTSSGVRSLAGWVSVASEDVHASSSKPASWQG